MRGVKGWSASAGEARSGAGESSRSSSRIRSLRSHAPTLSTQDRRRALAHSHRKSASAMELSEETVRAKAGFRRG
eukprot:800434-Pleurochrysis_carterae.AAC.1